MVSRRKNFGVYASLNCAGEHKEDYEQGLRTAIEAGVDGIHIDAMDGILTPQRSLFSPKNAAKIVQYARSISRNINYPVDVHLFVQDPAKRVIEYKSAGVGQITVPYSAFSDLDGNISDRNRQSLVQCLKKITNETPQKVTGISINPVNAEYVFSDFSIISLIRYVHIIGSGPGMDVAPLMPGVVKSVSEMSEKRARMKKYNPSLEIIVEGGVTPKNASALKKAGADRLILGHSFFNSADPKKFLEIVRQA